mmetsp:Transcript_27771/g.44027  ORF Transcript_27771/g.44027 Transcript_27771/m.44027 type:complete len:166 (-) Transcript_27771:972-1469(-)
MSSPGWYENTVFATLSCESSKSCRLVYLMRNFQFFKLLFLASLAVCKMEYISLMLYRRFSDSSFDLLMLATNLRRDLRSFTMICSELSAQIFNVLSSQKLSSTATKAIRPVIIDYHNEELKYMQQYYQSQQQQACNININNVNVNVNLNVNVIKNDSATPKQFNL